MCKNIGVCSSNSSHQNHVFSSTVIFKAKGDEHKNFCYSHTLQFEEWNRVELELES
jgi:hypothetical protein